MIQKEENYKEQFVRVWSIVLILYFVLWGFAIGIEQRESNYIKAQNGLFVASTILLIFIFVVRKYTKTAFSNLRNFKGFDLQFRYDLLIVASHLAALIGLFSIDYKNLGGFRIGTVVVLSLLTILNLAFKRKK